MQVPFEEIADELPEELRGAQSSQPQASGFVNGLTRGVEVDVLPGLYR